MYLYEFLGITEKEYELRIKPFMDELSHKVKKVDQALLAIETNPELKPIEGIYCAYEIGLRVGRVPFGRGDAIKKLMRLELKDP